MRSHQSRCGGKPKPVSEPTCRWEIKKTERARNLLPKGRDVAAYSDGADTSRRNHDAWVVRRNQLEEGIQLKMYQTPGKNNTDTREEETTATANSPTRHVRARALGEEQPSPRLPGENVEKRVHVKCGYYVQGKGASISN